MKRFLSLQLFLIIACLQVQYSYATHVFGGELLYEFVSGNSYKISLTLYGDCSGQNFARLYNATPEVLIYEGTSLRQTIALEYDQSSGIEVSPVCPDQVNNTICKGGTLPGVKKFIYTKTIQLPSPSAEWYISFQGLMGNNSEAGRSNSITNINTGTTLYLAARLNNTVAANSSPSYTTIPTPYYCINTQQQYNQGASDPDNDSLVFSLMPAIAQNGFQVTYIPPYSDQAPLATANFNFNKLNGQMSFSANLVQKAVVVNLVEEYRNGVLVGSSMREMTIIILDNCTNNSPTSNLDNAKMDNAVYIGNNIINVCEGETKISFNTPITDLDGNKITASVANLPPGATANILNNNTTNPTLVFNWEVTNVPVGTYNMYLTLKDDNCPISSSQTIAYTIQILKAAEAEYSVVNPTRCLYDQHLQLTIRGGTIPRDVTVTSNGVLVKSYYDTTGYILDHYKPGHYNVSISSPALLCKTNFEFTVVDSGSYPYSPVFTDQHYCPYDSVKPIEIVPGRYGTIRWYNDSGFLIDKAPSFNTNKPGVYTWYVSELYKNCESLQDTFHVFVHEPPLAQILNTPDKVCIAEKVYLSGSAGPAYKWYPEEKISSERDGAIFTKITEPTTYVAVASNEFGCKDTTSITYSDIEQCCTFSYPNAFTPNGDGVNDGFRPLIYGNEESYELRIFNRWGQMIFQTTNPKGYWNGAFGGKACDMGTYYYMVRAKCATGHIENQQGEFILIR